MKQVDAVEVEEGGVIWKAVCFITPLSCHEGTTHTQREKEQRDRKDKEKVSEQI